MSDETVDYKSMKFILMGDFNVSEARKVGGEKTEEYLKVCEIMCQLTVPLSDSLRSINSEHDSCPMITSDHVNNPYTYFWQGSPRHSTYRNRLDYFFSSQNVVVKDYIVCEDWAIEGETFDYSRPVEGSETMSVEKKQPKCVSDHYPIILIFQ